jgi:hypothetical protein
MNRIKKAGVAFALAAVTGLAARQATDGQFMAAVETVLGAGAAGAAVVFRRKALRAEGQVKAQSADLETLNRKVEWRDERLGDLIGEKTDLSRLLADRDRTIAGLEKDRTSLNKTNTQLARNALGSQAIAAVEARRHSAEERAQDEPFLNALGGGFSVDGAFGGRKLSN